MIVLDRVVALGLVALAAVVPASGEATLEGLEFFESRIRPVLAANCYVCHSAEAKTRMGGLSLDTKDGIREGGQRGHAVVPNDPESSLILDALRYAGDLKMPPGGRLPEEVALDFERWIRMGAPDPREVDVQVSDSAIDLEQGRQYWAFQAPRKGSPPPVRDLSWSRGTIDQHVLAALEERGLRPVRDAGRSELLRRLTLDLTGLPPTPEQLDAFLSDDSGSAYRKAVDRLLESERFGERWGRHWLDVVRYADTVGRTRNLPLPVAWKYRNYVIRSFNQDKPYDQFIREQLAGDLLPHRSLKERHEGQIATGFLAIGAHDLNEPDPKQFDMDVADEMINATTRSFLALSVGCARCHDHKFDPIPTKDYYSMAAIFRSSELRSGLRRRPQFNAGYFRIQNLVELDGLPDYTMANAAEVRAERERLWTELQSAVAERDRQKTRGLARELGGLPIPENLAMGVVEASGPAAMKVNIGGDPHTLGEPVDRGFVQVLFPPGAELPRIGEDESGRLQLAEWLTSPDNPLTARVMANRIWHHLFGRGIVASVDNFGLMGRQPTNQALLDYLAAQFVEQGWSVKSLVREIVLSRTYRLSPAFDDSNFQQDPDNEYLWRANVRRLEVESLRDSVLLVSGDLEAGPPPPSPVQAFQRNQLINVGSRLVKPWEVEKSYRSVYVPVIRNSTNRLFQAFDFPEPSETHGAREVTTGPSQALFMLNSDFVRTHAAIAAERLLAGRQGDEQRVRYAFRQVLARDPSPGELARAVERVSEILGELEAGHVDGPDRSRKARNVPAQRDGERAPRNLPGGSSGRAWLAEMMEVALDREPETSEVAAAMAYLSDRGEAGAELSGGVTGMLETALGRKLGREERLSVGKRVRAWRLKQPKRDAQPLLAAATAEHEAWLRLYHALYNSAEFRYRN